MAGIYWSGPRESDIAYTGDMFAGSVTFYGSNSGTNRSFCSENSTRINHNLFSKEASDYILSWQMKRIEEEPDCRFMAYNPNCVYGAPAEIMDRTLCLNDEFLMKQLDDKIFFRELAKDTVPTLPMRVILGRNCTYEELRHMLPSFYAFVIQEPISSGGQGTFLMSEANAERIHTLLHSESSYIVTGYIDRNIPINIHAIIYNDSIELFPASVQIIQLGNDRLLYRGADYPTFKSIDVNIRNAFYSLSAKLLKKTQDLGYRGIIGVDAMISGTQIYFSEINNRFQGSSILLSKALFEHQMPSLQRMNIDAFMGLKADMALQERIRTLDVRYSMFNYVNEMDGVHSRYIFERAIREPCVETVLTEGYDPGQPTEPYASQFSVVFNKNITSISVGESRVNLHPNVQTPSKQWAEKIAFGDLTALKIALINRGVTLTEYAKAYIHLHGGMRVGTYFSLDLFLRGVYINTPLSLKLTRFSPFEIDASQEEGLILKFYGQKVSTVDFDRKESLPMGRTVNNPPVNSILFLATDRLRVQNNAFCTFQKHGVVCKFCEASGINNTFSEQDILDSLDLLFTAKTKPMFRHILVGGLSNEIGSEKGTILKICQKIRCYTDMPIYLMCLPPAKEDIAQYHAAGVTEFGFNIEIYDRCIAKRIMPGKGSIPLSRYMDALREAVRICGCDGAVRTAFIVGLEPAESLLAGVEAVCNMGVAPILSAFRPIPGTEMEDVIPPSDEWLFDVTERAEEICRRHGLSLGPTCPACRNNTLTVVKECEVEAVYSSLWRRS